MRFKIRVSIVVEVDKASLKVGAGYAVSRRSVARVPWCEFGQFFGFDTFCMDSGTESVHYYPETQSTCETNVYGARLV
jgi:hypothetical protein